MDEFLFEISDISQLKKENKKLEIVFDKSDMKFSKRISLNISSEFSEQIYIEKINEWTLFLYSPLLKFKQFNFNFPTKNFSPQIQNLKIILKDLSNSVNKFIFWGWNEQTNQILLCNDPFAKITCYYFISDTNFIFSSNALLLAKRIDKTDINLEILEYYLLTRTIPAPYSIFIDINKQIPSQVISYNNGKLEKFTISHFNSQNIQDNFQQSKQIISNSLISNSINLLDKENININILLSSGIDSSLLLALTRNYYDNVKAFTLFFDNKKTDEHLIAQKICHYLKVPHTSYRISGKEVINSIDRITKMISEPIADPTFIPLQLFLESFINSMDIFFDGTGADSIFYNKKSYYFETALVIKNFFPEFLRSFLQNVNNNLPQSRSNKVFNFFRITNNLLESSLSPTSTSYMTQYYSIDKDNLNKIIRNTYSINDIGFLSLYNTDYINNTNLNLFTLLFIQPWFELQKNNSIEKKIEKPIISPFLSIDLVNYAKSLPKNFMIRNGYDKFILRKTGSDFLPIRYTFRNKKNFSVPIDIWLKSTFREYFFDNVKGNIFFDESILINLYLKHVSNLKDYKNFLWSIIIFMSWYKTNLE
jgi:asparagine synthase (glutamine-hydrolysing)